MAVFVDDLVVAGTTIELIDEFKRELRAVVEINDLGALTWCLGMRVQQDLARGTVEITQELFVDDLLEKAQMSLARPSYTPASPTVVLTRADCASTEAEKEEMSKAPYCEYRSLVGSVMYLNASTRPDTAFAVAQLTTAMDNPGKAHWNELMVLLRYLRGTKAKGIVFRRDPISASGVPTVAPRDEVPRMEESLGSQAIGFADSDYARNDTNRRSVSGYIVYVNGGPVAWKCKTQRHVALSTMEAEIDAATELCKEAVFTRALLEEMGIEQVRPMSIYTDNQACLMVCEKGEIPTKAKHMAVRYFFVAEKIQERVVKMFYCPTSWMPADMLTKPLASTLVSRLRPFVLGRW